MSLWQFGLACLLAMSGSVRGEDEVPSPPILLAPPRYERPRPARPNSLQLQRSQYRARQRRLQREARAWRGISSGRPNVMTGVDVNGSQMGGTGSLAWQPRW